LSGPDADELVQALWDLPAIEARCRLLITALDDPELELPATMRRAAAVVRFLREEPLLPRSLTPDGWPADELRERYRDLDRELGRLVRALVQQP
jgi:phenylacetic acid degradation operon negative regulatory protein